MYQGTLAAASNRASWPMTIEISDPESGDAIDLTGASVVAYLRDPETCETVLTLTSESGRITFPATGSMAFVATPAEMGALCKGRYDFFVRITLASNGLTYQILAASLPVIDGGPA